MYTSRYRTPSPLFPIPSPTSLERLIASWEALRALDVEGYRTSHAQPMSTWLVDIEWSDARSVRSPGRGTTCSPFAAQSVAMAYSAQTAPPLRPILANGEPLSFLFSRAANGTLSAAHKRLMDRYGMTLADNEWPRPIIFFNMGYAVEPTQLRRGDAVHIDWMSGGGHAVFCWDVHLNEHGEVDAFQYVSSNGRIRVGGEPIGAGLGVSVGGTPSGRSGFIAQVDSDPVRYEVLRNPLFTDDERYVAEGSWVTWNPRLRIADLKGCRVRPRGRLSYARVVKAARFHGVTAPEPFAMGPAAQSAVQEPAATEPGHDADRLLQRQLLLLHKAGWIPADPGEPDGRIGPRTIRAIRAFQTEFQLQADGAAGPRTRARLDQVYQAACLSPAGKEYLATGRVSERAADLASVSFGAGTNGSEGPRCAALYFRHASALSGTEVDLIVEPREGAECEGGSLLRAAADSVYLRDLDTGHHSTVRARLVEAPGGARIRVQLPESLGAWPPRRVVAGSTHLGRETDAPLYLVRPVAGCRSG
jgi:hypothetical protein